MIIWIASYPKSGNTWVRLFLDSYFSKIKNNFKFGGFPDLEDFNKINLDYTNLNEIIKNWKTMQEMKNLDSRVNVLKTHNALCKVGNYSFTDANNTLGAIYLVRDPRDIVVSYANHLGLNFDDVIKYMLNPHASGIKKIKNKEIDIEIMGRWADNYNSWKNYKNRKFLIIKYENLVTNKKEEFLKILKYLKDLTNIEIDIDQMNKSIEATSFEKLKKDEELYGFDQATGNGPFFRKGIIGDWKNTLNNEQIQIIEKSFFNEMKELNYL
tara:strand:- start:513 stop:1316 length:804 start_codon:yes stop_codon:yes gene_type:complete